MAKKLTSEQIAILGKFLAYYESDLKLILKFHRNIEKDNHQIDNKEGVKNVREFISILKKFSVHRHIRVAQQENFIRSFKEWIEFNNPKDVDALCVFAKEEGITIEKHCISLASKVLYLYNPSHILPLDRNGMNTLQIKTKSYREYLKHAKKYKNQCSTFDILSEIITPFALTIEDKHKGHKVFKDIVAIRENRLLDKILWVKYDYAQ